MSASSSPHKSPERLVGLSRAGIAIRTDREELEVFDHLAVVGRLALDGATQYFTTSPLK
jgi:hypothetical protein